MAPTLLFTIIALASLASARPSAVPRQSGASIEFCTASTYTSGACPYAQPTSGSGTCGTLTVVPNTCYTFANFTDAPAGLEGSVNYISIPDGTAISGCNLYKTLDCSITADEEWDACDIGSTDLTCRKHLAGTITSWNCTS
ncbi:hypothetical protein N0V93_004564 [Gnomoniopsis smithogilvyi]|uniref:Uncharacterized protein n=1 Tax=Gnomoniopsis smithogilvyi TaxID=1191159 RepID=A0A9W9CX72_9PEZI|nr:hypothetical protein N0V93_004564 [Gnomoniopsis smithogilvyi]